MTSRDHTLFREALLDLKRLFDMHPMLGVFGPMHTAYYDALRYRIDRLVILAERSHQHSQALHHSMDVDGLKMLVDLRVLVQGLKREDITPTSLDSIIHPRVVNLRAHIVKKDSKNLTTDQILDLTKPLQTLNREGYEGLDTALKELNELHEKWLKNLAKRSKEELEVGVSFAYGPH